MEVLYKYGGGCVRWKFINVDFVLKNIYLGFFFWYLSLFNFRDLYLLLVVVEVGFFFIRGLNVLIKILND